jgi:putative flippase GtrA
VIARQALRFAGVGVVGFFVDAGVLTLAMSLLGLNRYSARCLSFLVAVTATWAMNRTFTFKQGASSSLLREWLRFCAANAVGGLVNLGTYAWLSSSFAIAREFPVAAVAAGSLSGLLVNFTLSRLFVFREGVARYG